MSQNLPFYIVTSDATAHILPTVAYLYNKYWHRKEEQSFTILGQSQLSVVLPNNFNFVSIRQKNDVRRWTRDIYQYIKHHETSEYFILTLDDYLPNQALNEEVLERLLAYARAHKKVGRIGLGWSPLAGFTEIEKTEKGTVYALLPQASYRLVCQTSVWNREYFLKYFWHWWTPWQLELRGSWWAKHDGWEIIGAKNPLSFDWVEESALSGRWPGRINVLGMHPSDVEYCIEKGMLNPEQLQYGMWTESTPPAFLDFRNTFSMDILKERLDTVSFENISKHYGRIYNRA